MEPLKEYMIDGDITKEKTYDPPMIPTMFIFTAYMKATGQKVVLKCYKKLKNRREDYKRQTRVVREATVLGALNHPNIVKCLDSGKGQIEGQADGKPIEVYFVVLEYMPYGNLTNFVPSSFSDGVTKYIVRKIAEAVAYVHSRGYAHLDIKPRNIMIGAGYEVKLIDFDISQQVTFPEGKKCISGYFGTPLYMAPEVKDFNKFDGPLADSYSFGMFALVLSYGRRPYSQVPAGELTRVHLLNGNWKEFWQEFLKNVTKTVANHEGLQRFIEKFLEPDTTKRSRIETAVTEDWLKNDISSVDEAKMKEEIAKISKSCEEPAAAVKGFVLRKTGPIPEYMAIYNKYFKF